MLHKGNRLQLNLERLYKDGTITKADYQEFIAGLADKSEFKKIETESLIFSTTSSFEKYKTAIVEVNKTQENLKNIAILKQKREKEAGDFLKLKGDEIDKIDEKLTSIQDRIEEISKSTPSSSLQVDVANLEIEKLQEEYEKIFSTRSGLAETYNSYLEESKLNIGELVSQYEEQYPEYSKTYNTFEESKKEYEGYAEILDAKLKKIVSGVDMDAQAERDAVRLIKSFDKDYTFSGDYGGKVLNEAIALAYGIPKYINEILVELPRRLAREITTSAMELSGTSVELPPRIEVGKPAIEEYIDTVREGYPLVPEFEDIETISEAFEWAGDFLFKQSPQMIAMFFGGGEINILKGLGGKFSLTPGVVGLGISAGGSKIAEIQERTRRGDIPEDYQKMILASTMTAASEILTEKFSSDIIRGSSWTNSLRSKVHLDGLKGYTKNMLKSNNMVANTLDAITEAGSEMVATIVR